MTSYEQHVANRRNFNEHLNRMPPSSLYMSEAEAMNIVKIVKDAKTQKFKSPLAKRYLQVFDVFNMNGKDTLIEPRQTGKMRRYLVREKMYDAIHESHVKSRHGGKFVMLQDLGQRYSNVTEEVVSLYLKMCPKCQLKKNSKANTNARKSRLCQIDLIDMRELPDRGYNHILVYLECSTQFVHLRPLESGHPSKIAPKLLDIFSKYGIPTGVYSHRGSGFITLLIKELQQLWSTILLEDCKPSFGDDRCAQWADDYIRHMIFKWMKDNHSSRWSEGIRQIQTMKNKAFHKRISTTPYKAMFGYDPQLGLNSYDPLENETLQRLGAPFPKIASVSSCALCELCHSVCTETSSCSICYDTVVFNCTRKAPQDDPVFCDLCQKCVVRTSTTKPDDVPESEPPSVTNTSAEDDIFIDPSDLLDVVLSVVDE